MGIISLLQAFQTDHQWVTQQELKMSIKNLCGLHKHGHPRIGG